MKTVTLYTDGACSGNPGPGGWGAVPQKMLRIFRGPLFDFMFRRAEINSTLAARHSARALPRVEDGPQEDLE